MKALISISLLALYACDTKPEPLTKITGIVQSCRDDDHTIDVQVTDGSIVHLNVIGDMPGCGAGFDIHRSAAKL